jgi:hydroxypyruvate isomerase
MSDSLPLDRRTALSAMAAGSLAVAGASARQPAAPATPTASAAKPALKGRIKHSACRWCYGSMPIDELCKNAAAMGISSVELLGEKEWDIPKKYGITCAVAMGPTSISQGWNRVENHDKFVKESERLLPLVKAAGLPNMIVFSGNRAGLDDKEGIKNCVKGLKRITPLAESLGVTVIMELLNSKVDHKDYQCDRTPWGVEVVQGVSSPRFKLLYDIYHMQIMEGDVIRTITDNKDHIAHFHTGGVPGRNEIDESQELNYYRVAKAIADLGFPGYVAQEFIPKHEPMASLKRAIEICDA